MTDIVERLRLLVPSDSSSAAFDAVTEITALRAEVERLWAALEPFGDMGKAMMGRKHPNEAVVQYALAPTIKVCHLVAAHEARAALEGK